MKILKISDLKKTFLGVTQILINRFCLSWYQIKEYPMTFKKKHLKHKSRGGGEVHPRCKPSNTPFKTHIFTNIYINTQNRHSQITYNVIYQLYLTYALKFSHYIHSHSIRLTFKLAIYFSSKKITACTLRWHFVYVTWCSLNKKNFFVLFWNNIC